MTREEMRMKLWCDAAVAALPLCKDFENVAHNANGVLEEFDKRFPPSQPEQVSMPIREIKDTGELGMTLDTDNPWNTDLPKTNANLEVKYSDGTTDYGWLIQASKEWVTKQNSNGSAIEWSESKKQVVAWREIKQTENQ